MTASIVMFAPHHVHAAASLDPTLGWRGQRLWVAALERSPIPEPSVHHVALRLAWLSLDNDSATAQPGVRALASLTGRSTNTVLASLLFLRLAGWISRRDRSHFGRGPDQYALTWPHQWAFDRHRIADLLQQAGLFTANPSDSQTEGRRQMVAAS